MSRISRISSSFAVVMIVYWAYALVVVPVIEPAADLEPAGAEPIKTASGGSVEPTSRELDALKDLFGPNDWEMDRSKTKLFRNDRAKVLLQEYHNLGHGKLKLEPCTIVFDYDGPADDEAQLHRQSIILQAPQGAILQFDRPIDLRQPREANLLGGQLIGPVCIRSDWKKPGPEDDLRIVGSNVRLEKQTVTTSDPIEFRWGPHFGSGQDMQIRLLPDRRRTGKAAAGLSVAGIESFDLQHVDRLHLDLGKMDTEKGMTPIVRSRPTVGQVGKLPDEAAGKPQVDAAVDITCRGSFRFDVVGRVATFNDTVHVEKPNPIGAPDRLDCDVLLIGFVERRKANATAGPAKRPKPGSTDLEPERFEARGNPAVVTAPSEDVVARAQHIQYKLSDKSLLLDGDEQVYLQQGANRVGARRVFYQVAADQRRLGQVVAQGPGWFYGQSPDDPKQKIEAVWQDQLQIKPSDRFQQLSLTGGAELKSPGYGQLQAKEINLWLLENPSAPKRDRLKPQTLTAIENVHISSPQLSGKVAQMNVTFEDATAGQGAGGQLQRDETSAQNPRDAAGTGVAIQSSPPLTLLPSVTAGETAQPPTAQQQHFEVTGRLLTATIKYGTRQPALARLAVEEDVRVVETQTEHPGERPVEIRGDRIDATNATGPDARGTVTGRPARFEGRGVTLAGSNINIDRASRRLWVDDAGQMDILIDKDLDGRPLPALSTLTIKWQEGMAFDGQTAQFRRGVEASTPGLPSKDQITQFLLRTAEMDVRLLRPVYFSEQNQQPAGQDQQIEEIRCRGGVDADSHTFDARQQPVSHDRMNLSYLTVNRISGDINGGAGTITSVRTGSGDPLAFQPFGSPAAAPAKSDRLICLHVTYNGPLAGNTQRNMVVFREQVRMTYGPAENWDTVLTTRNPDQLGPTGAIAECDELSVVQMPAIGNEPPSLELCMLGKAVVEGTTFKALGHTITYSQSKELFTIKGNGFSPAELYRQTQPGAPASWLPAQEMVYSRKTKNAQVIKPQMLEVQLPDGRKR
jgi:hypothetical protein